MDKSYFCIYPNKLHEIDVLQTELISQKGE